MPNSHYRNACKTNYGPNGQLFIHKMANVSARRCKETSM